MNDIHPVNQKNIIVNARFLTRRVTGLERYAIEISRQLKKIRPSLRFVSPKNIMHRSIAEELDVELYGTLTGHPWEQFEFPAFLRRNKSPLLLNLVNTGPLAYRNQLTVIHDLSFLRNPGWFSRRAAMWFTFLVPRVIRASSTIVTDSAFTKKEIIEILKIESGRIHVVYPGISEIFRLPENARANSHAPINILTVSTLEPRKNLERLIEGFKLLGKPNAKLTIVGGSNSLVFGNRINQNKIALDPAIKFLGYVSDEQLSKVYQEADIFASVSLYEGFGFPPLEALASGCKVLVSDIPTYREILGDGVTYVNPEDPADIAQKLRLLIETNKSGDRNENGKALSRYTWRRAAEELLAVADGALKSK